MPTPLTPDDISRVHALIENSNLEGIFFHELSAKRREDRPESKEEAEEDSLEIGVQARFGDGGFGIRLDALVKTISGEARVSVAGEYTLDEYEPTKRDILLFANEVAVMTLFPYLREGTSDVTNRVFGKALLLPIAPRGAISVDVDDPYEEEEQED